MEKNRRRWEDNIEADLKEIGLEGVVWTYLAQDDDGLRAVVNVQFGPS